MMMLRATPVAVGAVMLPTTGAFNRVAVPAVTVSKFVVEKPPCDPVHAVRSPRSLGSETPVISCMCVAIFGQVSHGFVLELLLNIAPVIRWLSLAVLLEVVFVGR